MNQKQLQQLNADAQSKYQSMKNIDYNIAYSGPKGREGAMLEAWQVGDEGAPKWPRSKQLPISKAGLEVFNNNVTANDLAADVGSHLDPIQRKYKAGLGSSLTPEQVDKLKHGSLDYYASINKYHMPEKQAMNNAVSSLYRGAVYNQWPEEAIKDMGFSFYQRANLHKAGLYSLTGQEPNGLGLSNLVKR